MDFSVVRSSHSLVKPCEKTPTTTLELSGMDKVPVLRCNARTLHVYKHKQGMSQGRAAASAAIKQALSRALVPYYPLAGRLRESSQGELHVDCCGEGVWFVEASANSTLNALDYLDDAYVAPISYHDLLPDQLKEANIKYDEPLIQMQVTQFACGGFVIGLIFSHTICDGLGSAQFLNAVAEFARGLDHLTISPVWCRDFFISSSKPKIPTTQSQLPNIPPKYRLEQANVDISMEQIEKLKHEFQLSTGRRCSTFEIVAAGFWSCRTRAALLTSSGSSNSQMVRFVFFANCRQLVKPPLPEGFYGNCFFPVTITASRERVGRASVVEVVKMIQKAKAELPREFEKYIIMNMNNINGDRSTAAGEDEDEDEDPDPFFPPMSYETLFVSEWGRLGFKEVDFGWGPPVNIVPIQGSPIMPAAIVGWQPAPKTGIRLMTWCLVDPHLQPFLHHFSQLFHFL